MYAYEQMVSAIGAPLSSARFHDLDGHAVAVGHWRHGDKRYETSLSGVLCLAMNLGGVFTGSHAGGGQVTGISGVPGGIGLLGPGEAYETTISGKGDVVMVFIDPGDLARHAWGRRVFPPLGVVDEAVRAALATTFVAARAGNTLRSRSAATALRHASCSFLTAQMQRGDNCVPQTGGLPPTIRCRVERLIERRLSSGGLDLLNASPPKQGLSGVRALAAEAGLSSNHFIRAFYQATGTTPHQHLMALRHQRAMALLGKPDLSIAEVADHLGFSSPAHFGASFRNRLGITPGEYRGAVLNPEGLRSNDA